METYYIITLVNIFMFAILDLVGLVLLLLFRNKIKNNNLWLAYFAIMVVLHVINAGLTVLPYELDQLGMFDVYNSGYSKVQSFTMMQPMSVFSMATFTSSIFTALLSWGGKVVMLFAVFKPGKIRV